MIKQWSIVLLLVFSFHACKQGGSQKQQEDESIRIVSLASSITKQLVDLGVKDQIAGATSFCPIVQNNKDLVIGTATEVNLEKITLLKPDLILASTLTKPKTIENLSVADAKVIQLDKATSFREICQQFVRIGQLVNKEQRAKTIVQAERKKVQQLRDQVPENRSKPKVFLQIGANPLFAAIPDTYMQDLIDYAGMNNIASDLKRGTITREAVITRDPEVIIIVTMGVTAKQEKQTWQQYQSLAAAQKGNIFIVDSDMACTPTPVTFRKTLDTIIHLVYDDMSTTQIPES